MPVPTEPVWTLGMTLLCPGIFIWGLAYYLIDRRLKEANKKNAEGSRFPKGKERGR